VAERFHISLDYIKEVGAREKWILKRDQIFNAAYNLMDERTKENILKRTQDHIAFGKTLQSGAAKKLAEGILPKTPHDIVGWIGVGIRLERQALGMDQKVHGKVYVETPTVKYHVVYGDGAELSEY
jgi:hypothetical protein